MDPKTETNLEQATIYVTMLAVMDLSLSFARKVSGSKIIHYRIPYQMFIVDPSLNPLDLIRDHILATESDSFPNGLIVKGLNYDPTLKNPSVPDEPTKGSLLVSKDVSDQVLMGSKKAKNDLLKYKTDYLINQTIKYSSKYQEIKDLVCSFLNRNVIFPINLMLKWCKPKRAKDKATILTMPYLKGFFPLLKGGDYIYVYNKVECLACSYLEYDEKAAFASLANQLENLAAKNLIIGNLSMPSVVELADIVGFGDKKLAVYCHILIDQDLAALLLGCQVSKLPSDYLAQLGAPDHILEGAAPKMFSKIPEYEIIEVNLFEATQEQNLKAVIESYTNSVSLVNKVAKHQDKLVKEYEAEKVVISKDQIKSDLKKDLESIIETLKKLT